MTLSSAPELKAETCLCESFSIPSAAEPPVSSCTCSGQSPQSSLQTLLSLQVPRAQMRLCPPRQAGRRFGFNPSIWCAFGCRIKVHSSRACRSAPSNEGAALISTVLLDFLASHNSPTSCGQGESTCSGSALKEEALSCVPLAELVEQALLSSVGT